MRALLALVSASFVLSAVACGSTKPLPFAELAPSGGGGSPDGSDGMGVASSDASNDASGRNCYDETQARPSEDCKCTVAIGFGVTVGLPCGYAVCSSGTGQEGICTNIATVIYVPGCPALDADASADGGGAYRLPPCDAGTSADATVDAGADADAF